MSGSARRTAPAASQDAAGAALFEALAEALLDRPGVDRSTMMGLPCLRLDGTFFASWDPRSRALVLRLTAERVAELVATGPGLPFAPNGRVFREWVAIADLDPTVWAELLDEAHATVVGRERLADADADAAETDPASPGTLGFTGFPEDGFAFLAELAADTTTAFVQRHRERYRRGVQEPSRELVTALVPELARRVSPGLTGTPEVGGSLFRFAVDRRFARDRPPYRTEIDLIFWEGDQPPRANPALLLRLTPAEVHVGAGVGGLAGSRLAAYRAALRRGADELAALVDPLLADGAVLSEPTRRRVPASLGPGEQAARFGVRDGFHVTRRLPRPSETASAAFVPWCAARLADFAPLHRWWVDVLTDGQP